VWKGYTAKPMARHCERIMAHRATIIVQRHIHERRKSYGPWIKMEGSKDYLCIVSIRRDKDK
jgi:hypothetical protein